MWKSSDDLAKNAGKMINLRFSGRLTSSLQKHGNPYPCHFTGISGFDAELAVFQNAASGRSDSEVFSRFQKEIWSGLTILYIIGSDDSLKEGANADDFEGLLDVIACAARSNGDRDTRRVELSSIGHGGLKGHDFDHRIWVDLKLMGLIPVFDGLAKRHPSDTHKAVLFEAERGAIC